MARPLKDRMPRRLLSCCPQSYEGSKIFRIEDFELTDHEGVNSKDQRL
jgi:hypothetical protein